MIKAVIFDMDGVIVDSERVWALHEVEFIHQFTSDFTEEDHDNIIGKSPTGTFNYLKEKFQIALNKDEFLELYREFALTKVYPFSQLSPFVVEYIKKLHSQKIPLAIASSSLIPWVNFVVQRFELKKYFQVIASADEIGGIGKPAPDIFLYTAKKLQIEPENCLVIEDSGNGVLAGKRAGMKVYGYRNGINEKQDLSQADLIFDDFSKLNSNFI